MSVMSCDSRESSSSPPEVIRYRVGGEGYTNVERYDLSRYEGSANRYRQTVMGNAYRRLVGPLKGKRILDVACGTGRGLADFARDAAFAVGGDASLDMLSAAAQKTAPDPRCTLASVYAQELPFRDAAFDVVTSLNFLHLFPVETQRKMVDEMKRVVKPGGIVVIELDNALQGLLVGPYKRWSGRERGSLPGEIRHVVGQRCHVARYYGAVFPILWRVFHYFPSVFSQLEKVEYFLPFNRLGARIYCKIIVG
jgi:ubiquinone/menaquinone biosynthesis C-methylase UbiE